MKIKGKENERRTRRRRRRRSKQVLDKSLPYQERQEDARIG
jgi:hypothetical protein